MTEDNFELVDRDYENCLREEYPRQIKNRNSSYNSIYQRFTNFRIKCLKNKLESMKDAALTDGYTKSNYEKKIDKKSKAIARLEEKINILSRNSVPANYVQKRAIKLKKKMFDNLKYNTQNMYSIGLENKEIVFGEEEPINVVSTDLDRKTIEDSINAEFSNMNSEEDKMDRESIENAVNEEFAQLNADELNRDGIEDSINSEFAKVSELDRNVIENSINEEFAQLNNEDSEMEEYTSGKETIGAEDIKDVINESFEKYEPEIPEMQEKTYAENENSNEINIEEPEMQEKTYAENENSNKINIEEPEMRHISQNNSFSARLSRYDNEGNEKEYYEYVPMTDEEIRESQIKLGFDENGNIIDQPKDTTERKVGTASLVDSNIVIPDFNLNDILVPPKKDINHSREIPIVVNERDEETRDQHETATIDDYNSLREKILYLKQQQEITRKHREDAQKNAEKTAEQAKEMLEMFEESEKNYAQSIDMLKAYSQELEEDCNRNRERAEAAENDARKNNDFINSHKEKVDYNNRIINEIDSIIRDKEENRGFSR